MKPGALFRRVRGAGRGSRALAIGLALVFWIAAAVIVGALLLHQRNEILDRATRNAGALALVLEAHTARTLEAVDVMLAGVADAQRIAPALQKHDPVFQATLIERLQAMHPYVRAIFVIGADGWVRHDTDYPSTPDVTLADRPYFEAHVANPALGHSVSSPLQSRSGLGWFLAVTRRIGGPDAFQGIAVAAVQPQYFESLYRRMGLGEADVITLYHRDGTLIARYPGGTSEIGKSFAAYAMFVKHLPAAAAGSYVTDQGVLDFERLVSYRALDNGPLVVAVAQNMASLLEGWHIQAIGAAIALASLMLLLAALVALFLRQQRLRDIAHERSAQAEKLEALGHLTGSVSHDFANLLNVMAASLRFLGLGPADSQRTREALAVAERAVMRGSQLIDRLRSFARRQPLLLRAAELNAVVGEGVALLRQVVGPSIRMAEELAPGLAPCLVDETELEVALVNLLVNAKDAGARQITLRTFDCTAEAKPLGWKIERPSDYVCLSVIDDGPGMPEAVRRRAIEPYFTTKGKAGTGLGLSQVYGFMRQIGGDLHIESQPGKGTRVHLLFPKAQRRSDTAGIAFERAPQAIASPAANSPSRSTEQ
jgi:signal transduction histidine kinase